MSLHVCQHCGTQYAPAGVCPHCGGGVYRFNWEEDMPKATVEGGPSHYHDDNPAPVDEPKPKPAAKKATAAEKSAAAALTRLGEELGDD